MPLRKRNLEGNKPGAAPVTRVVPVPGGIRLAQGDVVLSELRLLPGPTHSVFDVLASLVHRLAPPGEVAVLGFGAGGILAPMRALGCDRPLQAVDVDATGHRLFQQWCPAWAEDVAWRQADATAWLRVQRRRFACVLEDLSEPRDGDVHKPVDCRQTLPRLIGRRLGHGGVAVFNLVPDADGSWPGMAEVLRLFPCVLEVRYEDYLNRTLVAGMRLPDAGCVGRWLQADLLGMGSSLAGRTRVGRPRGQAMILETAVDLRSPPISGRRWRG